MNERRAKKSQSALGNISGGDIELDDPAARMLNADRELVAVGKTPGAISGLGTLSLGWGSFGGFIECIKNGNEIWERPAVAVADRCRHGGSLGLCRGRHALTPGYLADCSHLLKDRMIVTIDSL